MTELPGSNGRRTVGQAMISAPLVHSPSATVRELIDFFRDEHVHAALIITTAGHLTAMVERDDISDRVPLASPASGLGRLEGRTVRPSADLDKTRQAMIAAGCRRAAVTNSSGRLLGLLCLKATRAGFCSDQDVRARAARTPPAARLQCYSSGMSETPTLYEWAGGQAAVERMINRFYDRVEHDELLSPFFPGGVSTTHRDHVTTWWCEVLGGPAGYTEGLGGYPAMLAHHISLGITSDQRLRFATLMSQAADDAELPADPEFRAALIGYLEWGTRLAMHNSQPGADVAQQAPVPHWGWGVAPPYQP